MSHLEVDMHVNDLADFMFTKNVNNALIDLSLGGIENNKDLFFFCLDLFCKGLVILHGTDNKVDLDSITMEQFGDIKNKMELAGIQVNLELQSLPENENTTISLIDDADGTDETGEPSDIPAITNSVNLTEIDQEYDHKQLNEYVFRLKMDKFIFFITFNLIHNTK
jgi:hypothetical protein